MAKKIGVGVAKVALLRGMNKKLADELYAARADAKGLRAQLKEERRLHAKRAGSLAASSEGRRDMMLEMEKDTRRTRWLLELAYKFIDECSPACPLACEIADHLWHGKYMQPTDPEKGGGGERESSRRHSWICLGGNHVGANVPH